MRTARIVSCVVMLTLWGAAAFAATHRVMERDGKPARLSIIDNAKRIDVNNIAMIVTNTGSFAFDKTTGNSGLEFPKGTGKTAVFAAGLWMGGVVSGATRICVAEYSDEYGPGIILPGGLPDDPDRPEYKVYKLNRVYASTATRDADLADYEAGAEPYGAPDIEVQTDGSLNIPGDQMMWAVYNDADAGNHTNRAGSTSPLGLEVQQTTFAFNRTGALGNTIFLKYRIINKGGNTISNMFVSQWSDPDLGGFTDDLVGCDVPRSLGYVYNATNNDGQYLGQPPSVGYDFFQGPRVAGSPLPMSSFNKYINGTDPDNSTKTYNYMRGLDANGNPLTNPVTGTTTTFFVSGDPVSGSGWLDTSPDDRRLMLSSGPFTMAPGDTQEVVAAIIVAQSKDRLASISLLKFFDDIAQSAFDQNFDLANPPNSPVTIATPQDGAVQFTWDASAESYSEAPYNFEGYVVYQGASIAGPFVRVATFDITNGIQTVLDNDFDEESGTVLPKVKAVGNDAGLQYSIRLTDDRVRGGPLRSGTAYYYKVTAYSVGVGQTPQVLESSPPVMTVIPQAPAAGTDWSTAAVVSGPTYTQISTGPPGTDVVQVAVVDANLVLDATYKVGYKPDATGALMWYLTRTVGATVDTVLNDQTNFSGDAAYSPVDGIQVKVVGSPFGSPNGVLLRVEYINVGPNPQAWVGLGGDLGLPFFDGSSDYSYDMQFVLAGLSSKLNPDVDVSPFRNVEIRFNGTQKGYQYIQSDPPPRTYPYSGYVDLPFTVWDTENNRQLNAALFEFVPAPPNGMFDPTPVGDDPFGQREWIEVLASDYSGTTPDPFYTTTYPNARTYADSLDFMYVVWPAQALDGGGSPIPPDPGDKIVFTRFSRPAQDFYTFTTRAPNRSNTTLAKSELDRVKAVPNPYFTHSTYELNQFNRQIKFTHLPARCTVRLFNLAGDLVRVLEKNDNSSQLIWDVETGQGLPVGSGIYIFHVEAPGIGTKVGKVAVFMEKERLNNF
jgi:hypothetical protein